MQSLFLAIRKEKIVSIHGTQRSDVNMFGREARIDELIAIRLMEINARVTLSRRRE
jgi:hypothetical protein